jgi:predicted metalloprotease with PDZ domain
MKRWRLGGAVIAAVLLFAPAAARAQAEPQRVAVDATDVARGILHATLSIPVTGGPQTLVYPRWIPGEHGPVGPINELVSLRFRAAGRTLAWKRDLVDMFAFHVDVPPGSRKLDVSLDYLIGAAGTIASKERVSTGRLAMINWYGAMLYPQGARNDRYRIAPSITLPANWDFASALMPRARARQTVTFEPVTLETFIDSPLLTGEFFRKITLDRSHGLVELDLAAEAPEELAAGDETIAKFKHLVTEADLEYTARHWRNYHFLVTVSDAIDPNGIEHHESSDNRVQETTFTDAEALDYAADLLPHEFTHSWNGKYRRPAGLQVRNYQDPERTDMLWVYEGLTEYLGHVLASRSGLRTPEEFRDVLAGFYANLDVTTGRLTRPLVDTATEAGWMYFATPQYTHLRRGTDFYPEGVLMWLEADATIRGRSGGARSLDDFVRRFYGPPSGPPQVVTYTRADIVTALNGIAAYDWDAFLRARVDAIAPHPPAGGLTAEGWRLTYTAEPTRQSRNEEKFGGHVNALYSIGAQVNNKGDVVDVIDGSPASKAGLAPYMHVLAVGGRRYSSDALHAVLRASAADSTPIAFVVDDFGKVFTLFVRYRGGERYPRLVPIPGKPDLLTPIAQPREK